MNEYHYTSRDFYFYYLGESTPDEARGIEVHLKDCSECMQTAREEYAAFVAFRPRPARVAATEAAAVADVVRGRRVALLPRVAFGLALAAIVVLTVGIAGLWKQYQGAMAEVESLRRRPQSVLPRPVATLRDGKGEITIAWTGTREVPTDWSGRAARVLTEGSVPESPETKVAMAPNRTSMVERGPSSSAVRPVGLTNYATGIRTVRPTFRWTSVKGASEYEVTVVDRAQRTVFSGTVRGKTELAIPDSASPLTPGEQFAWQVTALGGAVPASSDMDHFYVISEADQQTVARLERDFSDSEVLLVTLYEHYGLYEEAEGRIQTLAAQNPGALWPRQMLATLRKQRRR